MLQHVKRQTINYQLPLQRTPFVGRTQEIAELTSLFSDPACRLVTLVGLGGIGKTRLALAAAAQLIPSFQAVYSVGLQALSASEYIIHAIAEATGLKISEGGDPKQQLLHYLRDKLYLLVLDNFEHLLDGAMLISEILAYAPSIKVLATSRVALNLQEEWVYPVAGMSFPDEESQNHANLENYSALQLFVQSARRIRADFAPEAELPEIIRICKLLGGMPLAIELAAAWVRSLSCEEIAQEIMGSLDFLETPIRNMPPRHQNMRAVLDQTWKLLSVPEREVFKRLSVFCGGATREAAKAVAGATPRIMGAFAEKSLLRRVSGKRCDLHELLRQFAEEQLAADPEAYEATRRLHCRYYMEFLHERYAAMMGEQAKHTFEEIEGDLENNRSAWKWAVEHNEQAELDRALDTLWFFYDTRALYREGERSFSLAIEKLRRTPGAETNVLLGKLLARKGSMCYSLSRPQDARQLLEESLELFTRAGVRQEKAFSYLKLGEALSILNHNDRAEQVIREGLVIFRENGDTWGAAFSLNWLGCVYVEKGDLAAAEQTVRDSLAINQASGNRWGLVNNMDMLSGILLRQGKIAEGRQLAEEALVVAEEIGLRWVVPLLLGCLAWASHLSSQHGDVWYYQHRALSLSAELQLMPFVLEIMIDNALFATKQGHPHWAAELMGAAINHPFNELVGTRAEEPMAALRAALDEAELQAAIERGKAADFDTFLQMILSDPEVLARGPASTAETVPQHGLDLLTPREREILQFVAAGFSNREIAEKLVMTVGTIKWYINQIYSKLQVSGRTKAIVRARELALIS